MILDSVSLHPFGGLNDARISFNRRLTVVPGPNEAGKSTFFGAVSSALLMPVKPRKNSAEYRSLQRFIPLGGDSASVKLRFSIGGDAYLLEKAWGVQPACRLVLPGGAVLKDEQAVRSRLLQLLPATAATCRNVLMGYQGGLARSIDEISADGVSVRSLSDILRSAVEETDGVSVDAFMDELEREYAEYFGRWDPALDAPEGNRGIASPWVKGVGHVLRAYYEKEEARVKLESVREYDARMDGINKEIAELTGEIEPVEAFLNDNREALQAAEQRRVLSAERTAVEAELRRMQEANRTWPVLEHRLQQLQRDIPAVHQRVTRIQEEEKRAVEAQSSRDERRRLARAAPEWEKLAELRKRHEKAPRKAFEHIDTVREAHGRVRTAEAAVAAGKLTLELRAHADVSLTAGADADPRADIDVARGETKTFAAGGRLRLDHRDWTITVFSGEKDNVLNREKDLQEARHALTSLLASCKAGSIKEAEEQARACSEIVRKINEQQRKLEALLEGESLEELRARVGESSPTEPARPVAEIVEERVRLEQDAAAGSRERDETAQSLEKLREEYGDPDALLLKVSDAVGRRRELAERIDALAPLPEGVSDSEAFVEDYKRMQTRGEHLRRERTAKLMEQAELKGREPEQSAEDLLRVLDETEQRLRQVRESAAAVARVREEAAEVRREGRSDIFAGMRREITRLTQTITEETYENVDMDRGLPRGVVRPDGVSVHYELLSGGTRDVLALALRLAMASYFLRNAEGFLVLDDPFVDMDPVRRRKAAEVLTNFAASRQTILFTCHPSHAELFDDSAVVSV